MADVLLALTDLMFLARIREAAGALALTCRRVAPSEDLVLVARAERPVAIIFDLHAESLRPLDGIAQMKADRDLQGIWTIGYFSHVRSDVRERAAQAGCDLLLPRSAFVARLPEIVREVAARKPGASKAV